MMKLHQALVSFSKRVLVPTFNMEMRFQSHFHMNGCAPGLALIERLRVARKQVIVLAYTSMYSV